MCNEKFMAPEYLGGSDDRKRFAKPKQSTPHILTDMEEKSMAYLTDMHDKKGKGVLVPEVVYIGTLMKVRFPDREKLAFLTNAWTKRKHIRAKILNGNQQQGFKVVDEEVPCVWADVVVRKVNHRFTDDGTVFPK